MQNIAGILSDPCGNLEMEMNSQLKERSAAEMTDNDRKFEELLKRASEVIAKRAPAKEANEMANVAG
jgi:hypothetical protein